MFGRAKKQNHVIVRIPPSRQLCCLYLCVYLMKGTLSLPPVSCFRSIIILQALVFQNTVAWWGLLQFLVQTVLQGYYRGTPGMTEPGCVRRSHSLLNICCREMAMIAVIKKKKCRWFMLRVAALHYCLFISNLTQFSVNENLSRQVQLFCHFFFAPGWATNNNFRRKYNIFRQSWTKGV